MGLIVKRSMKLIASILQTNQWSSPKKLYFCDQKFKIGNSVMGISKKRFSKANLVILLYFHARGVLQPAVRPGWKLSRKNVGETPFGL